MAEAGGPQEQRVFVPKLDDSAYESQPLTAPLLSGPVLRRLVVPVLESGAGRVLRNAILKKNGMYTFRATLGVDELSTFKQEPYPLYDDSSKNASDAAEASPVAVTKDLDDLFLRLSEPCSDSAANAASGAPETLKSIRTLYDGYKRASFSPVDVAARVIERVKLSKEGPDPLNAIVELDEAQLMRCARESEHRWKDGKPLSVLDGIPVGIKDMFNVKGMPSYAGLGYRFHPRAESETADSDIVKAMRSLGALIGVKCSMDELGIGVCGFNSTGGQVRNPCNRNFVAGGSSGGSAAAVAAGIVPVAIGTDAGGSVRIPAAACGLFGFKPSFGRISSSGLWPARDDGDMNPTQHIGPMANNSSDLLYMYYVLATQCPQERLHSAPTKSTPVVCNVPRNFFGTGASSPAQGLRVGVFEPWNKDATESYQAAAEKILDALVQRFQAHRVCVSVPGLKMLQMAHLSSTLTAFRGNLEREGLFDTNQAKMYQMGLPTRFKIAISQGIANQDVVRSQVVRARGMHEATSHVFKECDVLVTPALAAPPRTVPGNLKTGELNVVSDGDAMRFMFYANITGLPAVVIPVGEPDSETGLIPSAQIIGPPLGDDRVLLLASELESLVAHKTKKER